MPLATSTGMIFSFQFHFHRSLLSFIEISSSRYGLDYPVCNSNPTSDQSLSAQARQFLKQKHPRLYARLQKRWDRQLEMAATNQPSEGQKAKAEGYDACITDYMTRFLNKKDVQEAIHARTDMTWAECSASILYSFDSQMDYMEPVWDYLMTNHDLRVMIYSGDDDSICAPLGTQSWIWKLGYEVTDAWSAWDYEDPEYGPGQVGGYHVKFNVTNSSKSTLSFVTVHHAGHEVHTLPCIPCRAYLAPFLLLRPSLSTLVGCCTVVVSNL